MAALIGWCARNGIHNEHEIALLVEIFENVGRRPQRLKKETTYPHYKPLRKMKGLTQQEVAAAVGTSKPMISYIENHQIINPDQDLLGRLNVFFAIEL